MRSSLIIIFVLGLFIPIGSNAQITIAPTNIFVSESNRFGSYMVINNSDTPQEITIDFFFGYSVSDSLGNRRMKNDDGELASKHSVASYVNAFPQNFVLSSGERRVVRLRVSSPDTLDSGTYWARVRTTAIPQSTPVELDSEEQVTARVDIAIEQITGLYYKKGSTSTGIEVIKMNTSIDDNDILTLRMDLNRNGNSPFLGSIKSQLIGSNGEVLEEVNSSTTIFFDTIYKHQIDISDIPAGEYGIQVEFETRRNDISSQYLVQMEPVTATTTVTIP